VGTYVYLRLSSLAHLHLLRVHELLLLVEHVGDCLLLLQVLGCSDDCLGRKLVVLRHGLAVLEEHLEAIVRQIGLI